MTGINWLANVVVAILVFAAIAVMATGLFWGKKRKKVEAAEGETLAAVAAAAVSKAVTEAMRPLNDFVLDNGHAAATRSTAIRKRPRSRWGLFDAYRAARQCPSGNQRSWL